MGWQIKTKDGALYGPVDSEILKQWIQQKRILDEDFVWMEDKKQWVIIKSVSELQYLFKEGVPPIKKQEIPKVRVSIAKDSSDTLYDDKKTLTDQLIADAWRAMLTKGIWSIIGAIILMGMVLIIAAGVIAIILKNFRIPSVGKLIEQLVFVIIFAPLILGWTAYSLKVARRERFNVGTIFEGFKSSYIWQALGAMLLMSWLPNLAGLISFGIWGVYLQLSYMMSYFFIFDENRGPWEGMKSSFDATKGFKWRIIAIQIVCMFLGMLSLGIGLIVTMPLANIAIASLYYRIQTHRISEKHMHTQFSEYLIVLIPSILIIVFIVAIAFVIFGKQLPFLPPHIEQIIKDVLKEQLKR